ncbi:MAG: YegS/Rv2252/BmrU family lipid kinase [Alphaproteobacteria bacterium]|nr:YegS/Rv2252/BmrU family lipid kinase [Alphaproteobacteria bacterium]
MDKLSNAAPKANPPSKVDCFINPNARAAQEMADTFVAALEKAGIDVTVHWTKSSEQALQAIKDLPETDAILVGGGDGTISGLLPALLERKESIGILPLGTANDFARGVGIPPDPEAAAKVIAKGHRLSVDTGMVADRPFLNVASLGISVEIASLHEDRTKKLLGRFAYPIRWAEAWHRHRPLKLKITLDEETRHAHCSLLAVGCGRHYGGGLTLHEKARLNDGLLRLYYVSPHNALHWLWFLPGLWRGTLRDGEDAHTGTAQEVSIETRSNRSKKVNVDGEIVAQTPLKISIRPKSLTIFAPAGPSD